VSPTRGEPAAICPAKKKRTEKTTIDKEGKRVSGSRPKCRSGKISFNLFVKEKFFGAKISKSVGPWRRKAPINETTKGVSFYWEMEEVFKRTRKQEFFLVRVLQYRGREKKRVLLA